jgi:hypothetical protein
MEAYFPTRAYRRAAKACLNSILTKADALKNRRG